MINLSNHPFQIIIFELDFSRYYIDWSIVAKKDMNTKEIRFPMIMIKDCVRL